MIIKKLRVVALACLLSTNVFAGSMGYESGFGGPGFFATLSLGPAWARPGDSQVLTLQPEVRKAYVPLPAKRTMRLVTTGKGTDSMITGELFAGYRGPINSVVEGQLGVVLGASSQAKLKGDVYEDADPLFNNYSYSYGVRNTRIAVKAKLLYDTGFYDLYPYLSASGGLSYNHASGFAINPKIIEEVAPPLFRNNNETEFTYGFGVGLEVALETNWRLGLGYEFVDWGKSALGPALDQTLGDKSIRLGVLQSHELLISLSFVA